MPPSGSTDRHKLNRYYKDYDKRYIVVVLQINGETSIPVGEDVEPVLLNVTHGNPSHFSQGFPKNMTVEQLSGYIASVADIPQDRMSITRLIANGKYYLNSERDWIGDFCAPAKIIVFGWQLLI